MTKYLDEYSTARGLLAAKVQSDTRKLKFNNIHSCVAVTLLPAGGNTMTGVHLTTANTGDRAILARVMQELRNAVGAGPCDAYLVSHWSWHSATQLAKELKKIARALYLCDVPVKGDSDAAQVDVKFELTGGRMVAYVRDHAVFLKDARGGVTVNPRYNRATAAPGKPMYLTDRDDKPWQAVAFRKLP